MTDTPRVLIVDDEKDVRWLLAAFLQREGMKTLEAQDGIDALARVRTESPDVVLLDIKMPHMDGLEVLKEVRKSDLTTPVIMLTAHGTIETAVKAVKAGAYDFLTKPFESKDVLVSVRKALGERSLRRGVGPGSARPGADHPLHRSMGPSSHVASLAEQVDRVADTTLTVLVTGESGTGKEVVARMIHQRSQRDPDGFVAVDCGSLPAGLVENELFGHQKGAYTGAAAASSGKFEAASGGTLFLDEVGNFPLVAQGTLLRVLQDKAVHRIGSVQPIPVDVRVVAATNRDLLSLVQAGEFRVDLYHRLAEFGLNVAPLRERKEDLPFLVDRFLDEANKENHRAIQGVSEPAWSLLLGYSWPGNVRELRNVVRRAVILADTVIGPEHLSALRKRTAGSAPGLEDDAGAGPTPSLRDISRRAVREVERRALLRVLKQTGGNKAKAARILQVDYKTIHSKVKEYGIQL